MHSIQISSRAKEESLGATVEEIIVSDTFPAIEIEAKDRRKGDLSVAAPHMAPTEDNTSSEDGNYELEDIPQDRILNKKVSFSSIEIREFNVVLGDNPCAYGPSLSLGWNCHRNFTMEVDNYEESKPVRRSQKQMQLPRYVRERILMDFGFSRREMNEAIEESTVIKKQRQQTVDRHDMIQKVKGIFNCRLKRKKMDAK
uniref:Uncharacterized protein n=1 Tax=Leptocylindrus danicus TaxID=163516 RepID=A0A6U2PXV6_9STRA|mmetsp:Transcript_28338/g.41688  ORF Transcript_28338/g.41688 Transcript_28338/m.41688 type:complete len:199 (+) Transcript_28338:425-1021(+)|eukprot:CAMPEP_0116029550 /NCGR_PEP_ID=MMETSP0321-20121206/16206_1 /TAXON_ID=163516 /ORGANISM="Leptocylindrus danicus var. danicus, Strain B650" /LENGTH=198 /DNA_ID=CAMNT_0003503947 /DNA_START=402 /DNA_END=998 /DNA_ORIENTATION=+